jgi:hypothetical protein
LACRLSLRKPVEGEWAMGMLRRASVLLVVLLLSGCWLQPGFGPERQSSNPFETTLTPANVAGVDQAGRRP